MPSGIWTAQSGQLADQPAIWLIGYYLAVAATAGCSTIPSSRSNRRHAVAVLSWC
jgi:hypothetical protein